MLGKKCDSLAGLICFAAGSAKRRMDSSNGRGKVGVSSKVHIAHQARQRTRTRHADILGRPHTRTPRASRGPAPAPRGRTNSNIKSNSSNTNSNNSNSNSNSNSNRNRNSNSSSNNGSSAPA